MKKVVVRLIGVMFIALGTASLAGLLLPEARDLMISVPAVFIRYSLMVGYGVGLVMLRKWGVYLAVFALALNWGAYFLVYDGSSATTSPLWVSMIVPAILAGVFYLSWDSLK